MSLEPFSSFAGNQSPKILFVGEAWGETEAAKGRPFCGHAGRELTKLLVRTFPSPKGIEILQLMELWQDDWLYAREDFLKENSLGVTNVFNLRPRDNKLVHLCYEDRKERPKGYNLPSLATVPGKGQIFLREEFLPEVERLWEEIRFAKPNLIVPLGNTACWAILGRRDISQIRGTTTISNPIMASECNTASESGTNSQFKVLPTFHPSAILQGMHKWRPIVQADFLKAKRESESPELKRPERRIVVNPTLEEAWLAAWKIAQGSELACDTETAKGQITRVSFSSDPSFALVVPFRDKECKSNYWPTISEELEAWDLVQFLLELPCVKVFQNGLYDLQFFAKMGIQVRNCSEDTLILHHGLFLEMQKSLGFLGSIYTDEPAWKLMRLRRKERGEKEDE